MVRRLLDLPRTPLVLLGVVSLLSLGARAALLGEPCQSPCHKATDHTLVFDEAYYVNAARVIAGIRPPAGAHYADAPLGTDPNAEHPQLVKLIMAGGIELFGDGPFAWRIGSLIFGSIAILGMFALVRAAGGSRWSALGASALMACDNLLLIHGRIGTLDIYAAAAMIWTVALYLRGRPLLAGLALAIGSAFKLVAPYVIAVLVLLEVARVVTRLRDRGSPDEWRCQPTLRRLAICIFTGAGVFMGLLGVMDQIATPYNDAAAKLITGGPFDHLAHMVTYAAQQVSPNGPKGIASYPWAWLIDLEPITYLRINPSQPGGGLYAIHPVSKFIGMVSPPIMLLALPALAFAGYRFLRLRPVGGDDRAGGRASAAVDGYAGQTQLAIVGVAWFIGTWAPFAVLSLIDQRTSYLYYMVVVMPGIYIAVTYLVSWAWALGRRAVSALVVTWALSVLVAAIVMYPFTPFF
ncbi:MAG: phospholipid carrier-dependent glycosyltransferase [Solirubrobacteraceae bacterium]